MKHRIISLLMLLPLLALPVFAAQEGSLQVRNVEASVTCYMVADKDGVPTADFGDCGITEFTEQTATPAAAKQLKEYALNKQLTGKTLTPEDNGEVLFTPLTEAWYLVCSNASPGEFAPFLMQIPTKVGSNLIYHVQATPKEETPSETQPGGSGGTGGNIPQTGYVQWPKYLLLALGGACVLAGAGMTVLGQEKRYD